MKKLLLSFVLVLFLSAPCLAKDVWVNGHYKSNGTYVEGHHRTAPDKRTDNNYSNQGNFNPWTGKTGTEKPEPRPYSPPGYSQGNPYGNPYQQQRGNPPGYGHQGMFDSQSDD